jgi:hypothetical protein
MSTTRHTTPLPELVEESMSNQYATKAPSLIMPLAFASTLLAVAIAIVLALLWLHGAL